MSSRRTPSEAPISSPSPRKGYLRLEDAARRNIGQMDAPGPHKCEEKKDTDNLMNITDKPISEVPEEAVEPTASEQQELLEQTSEHPVTITDHVEAASDTRLDVKDSLASGADDGKPVSSRAKIDVPKEKLDRIGELLRGNTLDSHLEALAFMEELGIVASKRWNELHCMKAHELSSPNRRRNSFARIVRTRLLGNLEPGAVVMNIGCGFGNDDKYMARYSTATFQGIDISEKAIIEAQKDIDRYRPANQTPDDESVSNHWTNRITLEQGNFFPDLDVWAGLERGLAVVYSHSTLHYAPPLVLREMTFPLIARALTGRTGTRNGGLGKLCLAMKTSKSDSARSRAQYPLVPGDPYNPSLDLRDMLFRIYPRSITEVKALLEPSFRIDYSVGGVQVKGYDRPDKTEQFSYIIATPLTEDEKREKTKGGIKEKKRKNRKKS